MRFEAGRIFETLYQVPPKNMRKWLHVVAGVFETTLSTLTCVLERLSFSKDVESKRMNHQNQNSQVPCSGWLVRKLHLKLFHENRRASRLPNSKPDCHQGILKTVLRVYFKETEYSHMLGGSVRPKSLKGPTYVVAGVFEKI
jgi:hypothetical protein